MTLLASERSLLIRNKFRSVLQLRIQNRRQQNEISADTGVKATCHSQPREKDRSDAVCVPDDSVTRKTPPSGLSTETAHHAGQDWCGGGGLRQKKARLAEDLSEKILRRPGPLELLHKHILPLEPSSISFTQAADVFEDDISCSSSSSSPEQLGIHQSPGFSMSPGLAGDQSLSDLSPGSTPLNHSPNNFQCSLALLPATEGISQPMTMTVAESNSMATSGRTKSIFLTTQATPLLPKVVQQSSSPPPQSSLTPPTPSSRVARSRKPRDSKPKMKKLKYHQYIPPDQRGGAGGGAGGGAVHRNAAPPIDSAYSRLLQQQQVFLQLQILNQQQQQQQQEQQQQQQQQQLTVTPSGDQQIVRFAGATSPACSQAVPTATNPTPPADTSPAHKPELLPPNLDDLTVSELRQQLRKRGLPVSGTKPSLLERLRPYQLPRPCVAPAPLCQPGTNMGPSGPVPPLNPNSETPGNPPGLYIQPNGVGGGERPLAGMGFLTAGAPGSAAALPHPPASPASSGAPWRPGQAADERSVEMEMRERLRSRPRDRAREVCKDRAGHSNCENALHPFLQQETGRLKVNSEVDGKEMLFTQVFCCQPCDVIGQDFELPMQITASPVQAPPTARSLEEELQEAIQRVQMAPSQSIEDILDEPMSCADSASSVSDLQAAVAALSGPSTSPVSDQSQPPVHIKEENFLSSPLCSSLLLELPPSPSSVSQVALPPPPPPPPICTTPPPMTVSRKRREAATFDPADWLESLTSGLRPLTPPAAPFVETDFGLDSDLNVNRVLDLMVEQW